MLTMAVVEMEARQRERERERETALLAMLGAEQTPVPLRPEKVGAVVRLRAAVATGLVALAGRLVPENGHPTPAA